MIHCQEAPPFMSNTFFPDMVELAKNNGINVILSAAAGNYTISYNGSDLLSELIRHRQWLAWWAAARRLRTEGNHRTWRSIIYRSVENQLPPWLRVKLFSRGRTKRFYTLDDISLISDEMMDKYSSRLVEKNRRRDRLPEGDIQQRGHRDLAIPADF